MDFSGKKVIIAGSGISGLGAYDALTKSGAQCVYYDSTRDLPDADLIVVSPGFAPNHEIFALAKKHKIKIIGEIELGYLMCTAPIIAVTGTNGKTTVTDLIGYMLRTAQKKPLVCGNIGTSFSAEAARGGYDAVALEVSSFQLETVETFKPHIAVITNITPDHLDRHLTMQEYVKAKFRICKKQTKDNYLILPDNINSDYIRLLKTEAQVITVSASAKTNGCYLSDGKVIYGGEIICLRSDIGMRGTHNVYNVLMAVTAAKLAGVSTEAIKTAVKNYQPKKYRIAFSGMCRNKKFFNDSKGTNIDASVKACESMDGTVCLIAGGSDKGYGFEELFANLPCYVTYIIAIGAVSDKIMDAAAKAGYANICAKQTLREAVYQAVEYDAENILLSPATASFDAYLNYEERGRDFDDIIKELKNETT